MGSKEWNEKGRGEFKRMAEEKEEVEEDAEKTVQHFRRDVPSASFCVPLSSKTPLLHNNFANLFFAAFARLAPCADALYCPAIIIILSAEVLVIIIIMSRREKDDAADGREEESGCGAMRCYCLQQACASPSCAIQKKHPASGIMMMMMIFPTLSFEIIAVAGIWCFQVHS
jgi:hypothetical protein